MRKKLGSYIILFLISFNLQANQSTADSLLKILQESEGDQRMEILNQLSKEYMDNSVDKSLVYANELLKLAQQDNNSKYLKLSFALLGELYFYVDDISKSLMYFEKQLVKCTEQKDSTGISNAYNNLGIAYRYNKEYKKSIDCYLKSLNIKEIQNDQKGICKTLNNLGVVYFHLNDYYKALEYYKRSLKIEKKIGNQSGIATSLVNIGEVYSKLNEFDKALSHFQESIEISEEINNLHTLEVNYFCLYEMYKQKTDFRESLYYYELFTDLKNERLSQETKREIAELEINYKTNEKQREIELLNHKNKSKQLFIIILLLASFIFIVLIILFINQINKRKKAFKLLRDKNQMIMKQSESLNNLNKTKDKFFSIISHDLKGAIGGFLHQTEFLAEDFSSLSPNDMHDLLKKMNQSSKQLYSLLENLLQWSRTQTGKIQPKKEKFNLNELVENTILIFKSHLKEKELSAQISISKDIYVFADFNMINTVFRNIVHNAIKFSNPNSTIYINSKLAGSEVQIAIKDEGVGMQRKDIEKLFDVGQSFSNPGTNRERGSGLGLIICKDFIELNGGKIWVKSNPDQGSEFIFTLQIF